ncbi:MAG TPA: hypothetical protein VF122_00840 [Caulobacteraceae bacterium]
MEDGYLIQFVGSAIAIAVLTLIAAWARIPRATPKLDDASARAIIAEDEPDLALDHVWVDAAGLTAVAKAGAEGVVLFRVGDGFAVRTMPWAEVASAAASGDRAVIAFHDPGAPKAVFQLPKGADRLPFAGAVA